MAIILKKDNRESIVEVKKTIMTDVDTNIKTKEAPESETQEPTKKELIVAVLVVFFLALAIIWSLQS